MKIKQIMDGLQHWLMVEGRCLSCGKLLEDGRKEKFDEDEVIVCNCSKIYVYNSNSKVYEKSMTHYYQLEATASGRRNHDEL